MKLEFEQENRTDDLGIQQKKYVLELIKTSNFTKKIPKGTISSKKHNHHYHHHSNNIALIYYQYYYYSS